MAVIIRAPDPIPDTDKKILFLAGSVDSGETINWRTQIEQQLMHRDIVILNPHRRDWDATWKESISDPQFKQQVEWELEALERADQVLMYFAPESKSPITLLELGLMADKNKLVIVCPEGYWKKGNVEVVAERYGISVSEYLNTTIQDLGYEMEN